MSFSNWNELCDHLGKQFGIDVDLNGVLFLIGIRERGLTFQPFSKEEKMSLIHLGSCTLYQEMGLVQKTGIDQDGWPLFTQKALARAIPEERKHKVLQDCALRYFKKIYPGNAPL
ncbi:MAG TPA: hypothetical protein VN249_07325 [Prolixibacteraceae bacterium]|nr:hypothetical protein [Prolixibacteraceae bacterium]